MGKKKKKDGKGGKLPKHIAGVKVPKQLREPGGKLLEAISNPVVVDMAAAALLAAAAKLREAPPRPRASGATASTGNQEKPKDEAGSNLGTILAAAAVDGLRKIAETKRSGGGKA